MTQAANDDAPSPPQPGTSDARVVVVTGASRGIGYYAAQAFGATGAHVVAIARTTGGLEELDDAIQSDGGSATLVPLDLRDHDAIDQLGLALYERFGRVDVVVGNAAMMGPVTPLAHLKPKDFTDLIDLNVTANFRLLRSMDLLLRLSQAGRAVFLTSAVAHLAKPFWGAYATTKAALEAMVRTYAAEMDSTTVRVNLLDPGPVRTALRARAVPGEDPETLAKPESVVDAIMAVTSPEFTANGITFDGPRLQIKTD